MAVRGMEQRMEAANLTRVSVLAGHPVRASQLMHTHRPSTARRNTAPRTALLRHADRMQRSRRAASISSCVWPKASRASSSRAQCLSLLFFFFFFFPPLSSRKKHAASREKQNKVLFLFFSPSPGPGEPASPRAGASIPYHTAAQVFDLTMMTTRTNRTKRRQQPVDKDGNASLSAHSRTHTRHGYLIDGFVVDDEEGGTSDDEGAVQLARGLVRRARRRRRAYAQEYERLAKRQRHERVARGLPAEEEDNDSFSIGSTDTDDATD